MKNSEEARQIGADVLLIRGKFSDGLRGGLKQSRVSDALVFAHKGAQFFRDRKGDEEVGSGELALEVFFKPLSCFMLLAGRAMAIATGAIELMGVAAGFALVEGQAAGFGAAGNYRIEDFAVDFRHAGGVTFEVLGAEGLEDLIEGGHGPVPPSRD